jgi:NAD-dependent deacetylase
MFKKPWNASTTPIAWLSSLVQECRRKAVCVTDSCQFSEPFSPYICITQGIDTFRGSKGLWSGFLGSMLLFYGGTPFGWNLTPGFTWSMFLTQFYEPIAKATPHSGYLALTRLQAEKFPGNRMQVITMNVDGLHQAGGFDPNFVHEVHGTVRKFRCVKCSLPMPEIIDPLVKPTPMCKSCGSYPRPDVTLFYEGLPPQEWSQAVSAIRQIRPGDVMLVIGTSSVVYPAAGLPELAKQRGAILIEINPAAQTPLKQLMDIHIQAGAAQALTEIVDIALHKEDN